MHPPMLIGLIVHVTVIAIIGYFILFSASKAEGIVAWIGRALGVWVFILAILSVVGFFMMPHDRPEGGPGWGHHWGPHWGPPPGMPGAPPPGGPGPQHVPGATRT